MMSNSYTAISDKSDTEWKFARSKFYHIKVQPLQKQQNYEDKNFKFQKKSFLYFISFFSG